MNELIELPNWAEPIDLENAKIRIVNLGTTLHEHAYLVGKDLEWVRNKLGTTAFEDWIEDNIWFGIRTSYHFLAHTKKCDNAKPSRLIEYHPNINKIATATIAVTGQYQAIIIDPPWPMSKIERYTAPLQTIETTFDEYPTMTIEAIKNSQFPFGEHCHVFLWTTQKFLPDALDCFKTWGIKYILTMVWHKNGGFQPVGLPQYNCEFVLYGRKGSPKFVDTKDFNCCFMGERREHSRKPIEFDNLIRRVTAGSRIDVFTREEKTGFDSYGNEKEKF